MKLILLTFDSFSIIKCECDVYVPLNLNFVGGRHLAATKLQRKRI